MSKNKKPQVVEATPSYRAEQVSALIMQDLLNHRNGKQMYESAGYDKKELQYDLHVLYVASDIARDVVGVRQRAPTVLVTDKKKLYELLIRNSTFCRILEEMFLHRGFINLLYFCCFSIF